MGLQQQLNSLLSQTAHFNIGTTMIKQQEKVIENQEDLAALAEQNENAYKRGLAAHLKEKGTNKNVSVGAERGQYRMEEDGWFFEDEQKQNKINRRADILNKLTGKDRSVAEGQKQAQEFMDNATFMTELRKRSEAAGFGQRQQRVFEKQAKRLEEVGK